MKEFLLQIIRSFLNALNEIFEELNFGGQKTSKRKSYRQNNYPTFTHPATPSKPSSEQTVNPPPAPATVPLEPPQYKRSTSVLTFQERKFLGTLRKAIQNEYIILMKVRMGDFIYISNQPKDGTFYPNQVMFKHADFLLCGKFRVEPLLVIELDDSSHSFTQRKESDKVKDETCEAVGLPYLRIEVQKRYDPDLLRRQIKSKILEETSIFEKDTSNTDPLS